MAQALERPPAIVAPVSDYVSGEDAPAVPVHFPLWDYQKAFVTSPAKLAGFVGGVGCGKSYSLMAWVVIKMHFERGTGTVGGIFANTFTQLAQSTLPELWEWFALLGFEEGRDYVYNEAPPKSWGYRSRFKKDHKAVLTVRWWGQAVVRSLDQPLSIRGLTLGWAALDECRDTKRTTFDIILARLRCPKAKFRCLRLSTTPAGFNWVHEIMVDKPPMIDGQSAASLYRGKTKDNKALPPDYYAMLAASYDEQTAKQELGGEFLEVNKGQVYRSWSRDLLEPTLVHNPRVDWCISFDFNRTPFSVGMYQIGRGEFGKSLYAIDEIWLGDADTAEACKELIARIRSYDMGVKPEELGLVKVYGDPAGNWKTTKSNQSDYDIITNELRAAFPTRFSPRWALSAYPVMETVNAVNGLMKNSLGQSRLKVHPRCQHLVKDFERVTWKPGSNNIAKEGDENKLLTHACFAMGTPVLTDRGMVPVERLPACGMVVTADGSLADYVDARLTIEGSDLVEVAFNDGAVVRCTPDHLFLTSEGWERADRLDGKLVISALCTSQTPYMRDAISRCFRASCIGGMGGTSLGAGPGYTWRFGQPILGDRPVDGTCITRTGILATMPYRTSYLLASTLGYTCKTLGGNRNPRPLWWQRVSRRRDITEVFGGGPRIEMRMSRGSARRSRPSGRWNAATAEIVTSQNGDRGSVLAGVKRLSGSGLASMMRMSCAVGARKYSGATFMQSDRSAAGDALIVQSVRPCGRGDVFCIRVLATGCFALGNGAVVSNSDQFRYLCAEEFPIVAIRAGGVVI